MTAFWKPDLPAERYHAGREVSASFLRVLLQKSPAHARAEQLAPVKPDTPALAFGRAVHCRILEPATFWDRYAVAPKVDRRTTIGKKEWADFCEANPGAEIITEEDGATLEGMAAAISEHPLAPHLLRGGAAELSGYWTDAETGVTCRCRPDYARLADGVLIDLKTTLDASPAAFSKSIASFGYHTQAAHYAAGYEAIVGEKLRDWLLVAIEKAPPFAVGVYRLDEAALEAGEHLRRRAMRTIAECLAADRWPGYSDKIEAISLPAWAFPPDLELEAA